MIDSKTAHKQAIKVLLDPIETKILAAVSVGKFVVFVSDLSPVVAGYLTNKGYNVKWDGLHSAFIDWRAGF